MCVFNKDFHLQQEDLNADLKSHFIALRCVHTVKHVERFQPTKNIV